MSKKNNVIQFPLDRIKRKNIEREPIDDRILHELSIHEECIDLGRFCVDLIETGLNDYYDYEVLDLRDRDSDEYKDMFTILNLLVAMFMRKADLKHILQDDLSDTYMKLKVIEHSQRDKE